MKSYPLIIASFALMSLLTACDSEQERATKSLMKDGIISSTLDIGSPIGAARLCQAIKQKDNTIAEKLLQAGVSPNADFNGIPAFHLAICEGNPAMAKKLIELGANVDTARNDKITPLMDAAFMGQQEIVDLLIQKGCNVNAKSKKGWTALMSACAKAGKVGEFDVDWFKANGSTHPDDLKTDVQIYVSEFASREAPKTEPKVRRAIVQSLLDAGAEITADKMGNTPLSIAAAEGRNQMLKQLMKAKKAEMRDQIPTIFAAVWSDNEKMVNELVTAKEDPNATFRDETVLLVASYKCNDKMIKLLFKVGALPDHDNQSDFNKPLDIAIEKKSLPTVAALVDGGISPKCGKHIASDAVVNYSHDVLSYLVKKGLPISFDTLETAIRWKNVDCVKDLVNAGVPLVSEDKSSNAVYCTLVTLNQCVNDDSYMAKLKKPEEKLLAILDYLLAHGANVKEKLTGKYIEETPLMYVSDKMRSDKTHKAMWEEIAKKLVLLGA